MGMTAFYWIGFLKFFRPRRMSAMLLPNVPANVERTQLVDIGVNALHLDGWRESRIQIRNHPAESSSPGSGRRQAILSRSMVTR